MTEGVRRKNDLTQRGASLLVEVESLARHISTGSSMQQELSGSIRSFTQMDDVLRQTDDNITRHSFQTLQEFKQQIQYISFSLDSITPANKQLKETLSLLKGCDDTPPGAIESEARQPHSQ